MRLCQVAHGLNEECERLSSRGAERDLGARNSSRGSAKRNKEASRRRFRLDSRVPGQETVTRMQQEEQSTATWGLDSPSGGRFSSEV